MIDIGWDDGTAARDFAAHKLRRHEGRNGCAEALAVGEPRLSLFGLTLPPDILAVGDIDHLLGDDAGAGELELRHRTPAPRCNPASTQWLEPAIDVDAGFSVGVGTRRVVDAERGPVRERDLTERHHDIVMALRRGIDLAAS